jgi:Lar family restriction alleviation protein
MKVEGYYKDDLVEVGELKTCPFCGSPAEIHRVTTLDIVRWEISCTECPAKTHPMQYPQAVATFWNRRKG